MTIPVRAQIGAAMMILDTLDPPHAAAWLIQQGTGKPGFSQLLDVIRQTPDAQVLAEIDRQITSDPDTARDFADFGAYLHRREDWTIEVARCIKRASIRRVEQTSGQPRKVKTL